MENVITRMRKVQGQVLGIEKMYTDKRSCLDVVQQIVAARSALAAVARDMLAQEACNCASSPSKQKDFEKMVKQLVDLS